MTQEEKLKIKDYFEDSIDVVETFVDMIEMQELQNEQWVLDGLDRLNQISVRF